MLLLAEVSVMEIAERHGLLRELRREIESGEHVGHHVTTREWLEADR